MNLPVSEASRQRALYLSTYNSIMLTVYFIAFTDCKILHLTWLVLCEDRVADLNIRIFNLFKGFLFNPVLKRLILVHLSLFIWVYQCIHRMGLDVAALFVNFLWYI